MEILTEEGQGKQGILTGEEQSKKGNTDRGEESKKDKEIRQILTRERRVKVKIILTSEELGK